MAAILFSPMGCSISYPANTKHKGRTAMRRKKNAQHNIAMVCGHCGETESPWSLEPGRASHQACSKCASYYCWTCRLHLTKHELKCTNKKSGTRLQHYAMFEQLRDQIGMQYLEQCACNKDACLQVVLSETEPPKIKPISLATLTACVVRGSHKKFTQWYKTLNQQFCVLVSINGERACWAFPYKHCQSK